MSAERREWMQLVAELRELLAAAESRNECPGCGLTPGPTSQRWCAECVGELQERLAAAEAAAQAEVDEFNAGYKCAIDGGSVHNQPSDCPYDVWEVGFAWATWNKEK